MDKFEVRFTYCVYLMHADCNNNLHSRIYTKILNGKQMKRDTICFVVVYIYIVYTTI